MTLTIKLDRHWNSFQLANNTPPLSVTGSVIAPSARIYINGTPLSKLPLKPLCGQVLWAGVNVHAYLCWWLPGWPCCNSACYLVLFLHAVPPFLEGTLNPHDGAGHTSGSPGGGPGADRRHIRGVLGHPGAQRSTSDTNERAHAPTPKNLST